MGRVASGKALSPGQTRRVGHPESAKNGPTQKTRSGQGLKEVGGRQKESKGWEGFEVGGACVAGGAEEEGCSIPPGPTIMQ